MSRRIGAAWLIWSASILASRAIGLVREAVLGRVLGGGRAADVYMTAFVIPDFLNYLLAAGALSIVFIPIFGGYLARSDEQRGWEAFSVIANFLCLALLALLAVLWFALPRLAHWIAPGFDEAQRAMLVSVTRIVLPAQAFHIVGGLLSATLLARDRHALPALAPLVYNAAIVAGGVLGGAAAGPYGFAWGVLAGSVLGPFGLPLIGCLRSGLRWQLRLDFRHSDLRTYLLRSLPIMLGWSIVVLDDWILRRQGSLIGEGAIATLRYAKELMNVPMGVFGLAAGVAAYPTLTRLIASGDRDGAYATLATGVRRMLVLAFAAQVVLTCAGAELSQVLYGPKIALAQHAEIGRALALFSIALWAWAAQSMLARGFYAGGNTWLPTLVGTVLVPLAYPAYVLLRERHGTAGLASASAIAMTVYVLCLVFALRRVFARGDAADRFGRFFARMVPAVVGAIAVGFAMRAGLGDGAREWPALLRGTLFATVPLAAYTAAILALRVPEALEVVALVRTRLWRLKRTDDSA